MAKTPPSRKLSKSTDEYLVNNGWSSREFLPHAKLIISKYGDRLKVGRTVAYLLSRDGSIIIKFYVHHNGRDRRHLTVTDSHGNELETFHSTSKPTDVSNWIDAVCRRIGSNVPIRG